MARETARFIASKVKGRLCAAAMAKKLGTIKRVMIDKRSCKVA
jgi:hypothetical protein